VDDGMTDMVSTIIIAAIGVCSSLLVSVLMEKFGNRKRIKEIQDEINKVNKELMEATKKKDDAKIAKLEKEADKLPALMKESMILNFKGIFIAFPIIIIAPWLAVNIFPGFVITLPFNLPVPFRSANLVDWRNTFGPYGWFWVTFVILGGAVQLIYSTIKNRKIKV
jgi:uncharacterized membrane protein (DUF106 family)